MSARALGPLLVASVLVATGCTSTIVDSTETSVGESTTVITVDLTGTPEDLLAQFAAELQALSERIIEHDGEQAALGRIQALWEALQPQLAATHPELIAGFHAVVDLAASAVARRRPADADKARLNAAVLLAAAATS